MRYQYFSSLEIRLFIKQNNFPYFFISETFDCQDHFPQVEDETGWNYIVQNLDTEPNDTKCLRARDGAPNLLITWDNFTPGKIFKIGY